MHYRFYRSFSHRVLHLAFNGYHTICAMRVENMLLVLPTNEDDIGIRNWKLCSRCERILAAATADYRLFVQVQQE